MRILYDTEENKQLIEGEKADSGKIFSETIKSIELVSLPTRKSLPICCRRRNSVEETITTISR